MGKVQIYGYRRSWSGGFAKKDNFRTKRSVIVLKDIEGIGIIYLDDKDIVRHR
jgi:hypothetical protein